MAGAFCHPCWNKAREWIDREGGEQASIYDRLHDDHFLAEAGHSLPMAWSLLPDAELRAMAQGCTELTCIYHGRVNEEIRRRERQRALTSSPGRTP